MISARLCIVDLEEHFGAGDQIAGVGQPAVQGGLIPGQARILKRRRVGHNLRCFPRGGRRRLDAAAPNRFRRGNGRPHSLGTVPCRGPDHLAGAGLRRASDAPVMQIAERIADAVMALGNGSGSWGLWSRVRSRVGSCRWIRLLARRVYSPSNLRRVRVGGTIDLDAYDGNGNAATRNGNTVSWTSYNYPSGISSSGESVTFNYGPTRQRWEDGLHAGASALKRRITWASSSRRWPSVGCWTIGTTFSPGHELVAIYSRTSSGTNTVRYVLEDHQGSFASIVTSSGTPDVSESFTAYGNRRDGRDVVGGTEHTR